MTTMIIMIVKRMIDNTAIGPRRSRHNGCATLRLGVPIIAGGATVTTREPESDIVGVVVSTTTGGGKVGMP